ncbi:DUF998 domain-containing protein [Sinosporangium siamense]|uniref:DUF998 domain-containing protein n=1 Tax=Sinosporangium siamense TaxID=1367973 RepID=A0A919RM99_9ACTN|nr:DUF998 domain-containing protein [Sinosporangium siamense]GII96397.1 hypothetical protein Ssi02_66280 [Sinosporangium siamense]
MSTQLLLLAGAVSGPLFVAVFLIAGTLRPHYRQLRHAVSCLALGPHGWVQTANFVVTGLLTLAFAAGLWQAGGSHVVAVLIGAHGAGLIGAGAFVTDPAGGYPPGTPDVPVRQSLTGRLHDLLSVSTFVAWPIAILVTGAGFLGEGAVGWGVYSLVSGVAFFVLFVLSSMGFAQVKRYADVAGLLQRLTIGTGFLWTTLFALHLM